MRKINNTPKHTNHIIKHLRHDKRFCELSKHEYKSIKKRDKADALAIKNGIDYSIIQKHIYPLTVKPKYNPVFVDGKSVEDICQEITNHLKYDKSQIHSIIIVGLSGTGKGSTVKELQKNIQNSFLWSNGNIFRIIFWQCVQRGITQTKIISGKIKEDEINRIIIDIVGNIKTTILDNYLDIYYEDDDKTQYHIYDIQNTILKDPHIEAMVPQLAGLTQGHVINYTQKVIDSLSKQAVFLLEGRKETLDYISSDHRFELIIKNDKILGERRAAQKIASKINKNIFKIDKNELYNQSISICEQLLNQYEK